MTTLFSWFNDKIIETYPGTLPVVTDASAEMVSRPLNVRGRMPCVAIDSPAVNPSEVLRQLGAPPLLADVFVELNDCEVSLKTCFDGLVPDLECREKKRKRSTGQFYTPENLAARLVEMAEPGDSGDILDPACGDGSFLMAMAAYLQREQEVQKDKRGHPQISAELTSENDYTWPRRSRGGRVCPHPCGHDYGHPASLKLSGGIDEIQYENDYAKETKQSRCHAGFLDRIHGYDIDLQALFVCMTRLICTFPGCGWPALEKRDFLLEPPAEKFSVVIGNPPYRVNLDNSFKDRLLELYQTAEGEKDLYTFFIEGSLRALRSGGRLIMLTSHTYLVNHQCRRIRRFVFADNLVRSLFMLPERFFSQAPGVLPVVVIVDATRSGVPYQLTVHTAYSEAEGWRQHYVAEAATFEESSGLRRAIVPAGLKHVFAKMNECGRLGESCRVGVGIQESLKREGKVSRYVCDSALTEAHRPVLRGRELAPFKINWEGNYIDYGSHLAYAGDEKTFSGAKILYQNIRNERLKTRLVAAYDKGGFFPKNSLSFIVAKSDCSDLFVLGLLNSLLVNAWFSGSFHSFHVTVTQVRQIPLPKCSKALRQEIEKIVSVLVDLSDSSSEWQKHFEQLNLAVCASYLGAGDHSQLLLACDKFLEQAAAL